MRGTIVVWRSGGRETGHWSGTPWEIGGYNRSGTTCVLGFVAVALNDDNAPFKSFFFFFFFKLQSLDLVGFQVQAHQIQIIIIII
jgi:hypothetical protein